MHVCRCTCVGRGHLIDWLHCACMSVCVLSVCMCACVHVSWVNEIGSINLELFECQNKNYEDKTDVCFAVIGHTRTNLGVPPHRWAVRKIHTVFARLSLCMRLRVFRD